MLKKRKGSNNQTGGPGRIDWWLIAVLAIPVLYFLPELLGINVFAGIDTSRLNMPLRYFDRLAFSEGKLPLWNPYFFAGFPQLAESESGVFYPGNFFIHLPGDFYHWYSVEVVAHFMIAAGGFYAWMRQRGHLKVTSAFLAATYSSTPFLIFHITAFGLFTSIVWLPWYLVIFEAGMRGKNPLRTGLWLALFFSVMLMSGSVQAAFLGMLTIFLFGICSIFVCSGSLERKNVIIRLLLLLAPCLISPLIAMVQIMPTMELVRLSERAASDSVEFYRLGTWLNIPRLISIVIFPALSEPAKIQDYGSSLVFMGVLPFALMIVTLSFWKKRYRQIIPLFVAGVIALLLGFGLNLPGYSLLTEFPPFSLFRYPGRQAHIALTLFLALAGPALDMRWEGFRNIKESVSWKYPFIAGLLIVFLAAVGGLTRTGILTIGSAIALVLAIFFGIYAFSKGLASNPNSVKTNRLGLSVVLIVSLGAQIVMTYPFSRVLVQKRDKFDESLAFFKKLKSDFPSDSEIPRIIIPGGHELMDPDAISRLGFAAQENIWDNMSGNASGLERVTSLSGLTPLNQNSWKEILRDTLQVRVDASLHKAKTNGTAPEMDEIALRIIRMLGADVILLEGENWIIPGYRLWWPNLKLPFHERLCAYKAIGGWVPDARFTDSITALDGNELADFLRFIGDPESDVLDKPAVEIMPAVFADKLSSEPTIGTLIGRERGINRLTFKVSIHGPGSAFLMTGENYYPGWKVYVDGSEVEYYRTNYLLSGVFVPSGTQTVEMVYHPESFKTGLKISLWSFIIWIGLMCIISVRNKKRRPNCGFQFKEDPLGKAEN